MLRFYEINDHVIEQAQTHFSFLEHTPADVQMVVGDARLSLESEQPQKFDLLVLDAFSGDAIPTHLLTREAFAGCQRHLAADGIIAVHTSNLYFDLRPVVDALAAEFDMHSTTVVVSKIQSPVDPSSQWILMSKVAGILDEKTFRDEAVAPQPRRVLWSDSFSNLLEVLR